MSPEPARPSTDYDLFGLRIRSELPLSDLPAATKPAPVDVQVVFGPVAPAPVGAPSTWGLAMADDVAVLSIEDTARFAISRGAEIVVDPDARASERNVRLYLLGSAFGALLHQRGLLPLHANAIRIGAGAAAFMGRSGAGKSSLAGAFLDRGFALLADDVCVVTSGVGGRPMAEPGLPRLRLWRDAVEASGRDAAALELAFEGHEKFVVPTHAGQSRVAVPLTRLYLLDRLPEGETGQRIRRLTGVEALNTIMANIYRGQYLAPLGGTQRNLRQCLDLVAAVPVFSVQRQWGYDAMDDQIRRLEAHARKVA